MQFSDPSPNPYAAPQTPLAHSTADPRSWFGSIVGEWQRGAWPLVFLLNLGVPVLLGFALCSNPGRIGMILATASLLLFTTALVARHPLLRARWIAGGKIVAALQLLPFFHLLIGYFSLGALAYIRLLDADFLEDEHENFLTLQFLSGFLLTLLVGSGLLGLAYLFGIRNVSVEEERQIKLTASSSQ